ncbi:MAG: hypothetical protein RIB80_02160 [Rhodospirillales bacterium]
MTNAAHEKNARRMLVTDFPDLQETLKSALVRATVHQHEGQLFEADVLFRQLARQVPLHPLTAHSVGSFELLKGNYNAAWDMLQHRLDLPYYTHRPFAKMDAPYWTGDPMPDGHLLVFSDLGLGDAILLARFLPWVARQVGKISFQANEGTAAFWHRLLPDADVRELNDPLPDCDARINMFCLPRLFGADALSISSAPYIAADDTVRHEWRGRLKGQFKVGLCWQGNPEHARDFERSIPLAAMQPLLADQDLRAAGVGFHSLQVLHGRDQIAVPSEEAEMIDLGEAIMASDDPLGASAALIAELDMVIAVDSALANLAGAMNRPFWLPTYRVPDWRWCIYPDLDLDNPQVAPWYSSARLFRCHERGKWEPVIEDMRNALKAAVAA